MKITRTARKAFTAGILGFVGGVGASMADGNITGPELIVAAGTGLVAGVATYQIPNAGA